VVDVIVGIKLKTQTKTAMWNSRCLHEVILLSWDGVEPMAGEVLGRHGILAIGNILLMDY
jgi:hypothetical protein